MVVALNSLLDQVLVVFRGLASTDRASFDFWQVVSDDASEFILVCGSFHEPVAVHTQNVEPVEAVVNTNEV